MKIVFGKSKECKAYSEFIDNPTINKNQRGFKKHFPLIKIETALRIHKNLTDAKNAKVYNQIFGSTNNKIELQTGIKDKDNLILKNRITDSYRKFYHHIFCEDCNENKDCSNCENMKFSSVKEWVGNFENVNKVFIFDINNHDYKQSKRKG